MKYIEEKMQYTEAKREMEETFKSRGFDVISD